jgi:hypothetical protein
LLIWWRLLFGLLIEIEVVEDSSRKKEGIHVGCFFLFA